jgi:hypothetical protein
MKGIKQFGAVLAVFAMFALSTFADSRPRNESEWRTSGRNDGRNDERYERRDDRRDDRRDRDQAYGRGAGWISGVVRRVDYRRDVLQIRDQRTGRHITVDARRADRRNRRGIDVSDLQRGDFVQLEGAWVRGNVFQAHRIDSVDSRRR